MNEPDDSRGDLVRNAVVATLTAGAGLVGPDVGAAATALAPFFEVALARFAKATHLRRVNNASGTLQHAIDAQAASAEVFLEKAMGDDRRAELLTRALVIAQDTALRAKRRALGRALAAGVTAGSDAEIDAELLFIRAVADIDMPHILVLRLLDTERPLPGEMSGNVFHAGWSPAKIATRISGNLTPVLATLELHGLITSGQSSTPWQSAQSAYQITGAGEQLLSRLAEDPDGSGEQA